MIWLRVAVELVPALMRTASRSLTSAVMSVVGEVERGCRGDGALEAANDTFTPSISTARRAVTGVTNNMGAAWQWRTKGIDQQGREDGGRARCRGSSIKKEQRLQLQHLGRALQKNESSERRRSRLRLCDLGGGTEDHKELTATIRSKSYDHQKPPNASTNISKYQEKLKIAN